MIRFTSKESSALLKGALFILTLGLWVPALSGETTITVDGTRFRVNGELFDMWGIRVASALGTDAYTDHLIDQLDEYKAHGINTVTPFYMGSSGGHYDPFTADGTGWRYPEFRDRMDRIIQACDARGMIVVAGIFYQWKNQELTNRSLSGWNASKNAVATVAAHLKEKGYTNVILNIANEHNSSGYSGEPWEKVRNVSDLLEMVRIAANTHPGLLVGAGGYDHGKNRLIGQSADVDVLLFDTKDPENSGTLSDTWLSDGINKPHVNVELFGGWTKRFKPCGDFTTVSGKDEYLKEVNRAASRPALSVFFHANPWCQGPSVGCDVRFDLAGRGTADDPGMHWYFDYVQDVISGNASTPSDTGVSDFDASVTRLVLVNADTDTDMRELINGDTLDLSNAAPAISIRADVSGNAGSVRFEYDENSYYRIENQAPYTIAGDEAGGSDYLPWTPTRGLHTLSATPHSQADGNGDAGERLAIEFVVIADSSDSEGGVVPGEGRFLEQNGLLVIEAEHYHQKYERKPDGMNEVHYWEFHTDKSGYSGDGFMRALPDERCESCHSPHSPKNNSGAELVYKIHVQTAGKYQVWVRGMSMGGESNGIHIGIDGTLPLNGPGSNMSGFRPHNKWIWEHEHKEYSVEPILHLSAGDHTLHAWQRDDGFRLDKILLGIDQHSAPSGQGPQESDRYDSGSSTSVPKTPPALQGKSKGVSMRIEGHLLVLENTAQWADGIVVVDASGRIRKRLAGKHSGMHMDLRGLGAGVYFVHGESTHAFAESFVIR